MKRKKAIIDDGFNPELVEGAHFAGMFDFPCIDAPKEIRGFGSLCDKGLA